MNKNFLIFLLFVFCLTSCTDDIKTLEERIKYQAEKNNTEISTVDIKKTALYLSSWSKEDFYQEDIDKFVAGDKENFPENIEILFAGSSSIRFWSSLEEDMNPLKVLNRGFGGAHIAHVNFHFNEVIKPYTPQAIVFFCGTNDIAALKTPEETIDDFKIFLTKVRNNLPNTHVFVIGIKPSVARDYLKEEELTYNNTILEMSQKDKLLTFVDVWEPMLTEDGKPNPDLFVEDGLHMNEKGYVIWTRLVRESLGQYFNL